MSVARASIDIASRVTRNALGPRSDSSMDPGNRRGPVDTERKAAICSSEGASPESATEDRMRRASSTSVWPDSVLRREIAAPLPPSSTDPCVETRHPSCMKYGSTTAACIIRSDTSHSDARDAEARRRCSRAPLRCDFTTGCKPSHRRVTCADAVDM